LTLPINRRDRLADIPHDIIRQSLQDMAAIGQPARVQPRRQMATTGNRPQLPIQVELYVLISMQK